MSDLDIIFKSNREKVDKEVQAAIERGLEACGLQAEGYAKKLCPVDTGRLRNSITHTRGEREMEEYIGTNVKYAPYVEYGTSRGPGPRPYIRPAVEDHADTYKRIILQYLNELN